MGTLLALAAVATWWRLGARPEHAGEALRGIGPQLDADLHAVGSSLGSPAFVRIFKVPGTLELWAATPARYVLFRSYPICKFSGKLGPKTKDGDMQAPEGLYELTATQLNPRSRFYLSLNLGYPNAFETAHGWTGDALMIHGDCVSVGCYAMRDSAIAEIYTVVAEALAHGQDAVWVQALPFPLTSTELEQHADSQYAEYWRLLEPAYRYFETDHVPPRVTVSPAGYGIARAL